MLNLNIWTQFTRQRRRLEGFDEIKICLCKVKFIIIVWVGQGKLFRKQMELPRWKVYLSKDGSGRTRNKNKTVSGAQFIKIRIIWMKEKKKSKEDFPLHSKAGIISRQERGLKMGAQEMAQWVRGLASKHKDLGSDHTRCVKAVHWAWPCL